MRTVAILMLSGILAACSFGSGDGTGDGKGDEVRPTGGGTARTFAVADFTSVALAGGDDVDVRVGSGFSVRAEGPTEALDRLRIERDGDTLSIGRRSGSLLNWGSSGKGVKVFVTLPRLEEAGISGSGTMTVDRVEGGSFEASIAGSGDLNVAALAADKAQVSIAGSGSVRAAGSVKRLEVDVAGSGSLDAAGLRATDAEVSVAGSGDVRAAVTGTAKVELMGSGDVDLGAAARCAISKHGSGSVRCGR